MRESSPDETMFKAPYGGAIQRFVGNGWGSPGPRRQGLAPSGCAVVKADADALTSRGEPLNLVCWDVHGVAHADARADLNQHGSSNISGSVSG